MGILETIADCANATRKIMGIARTSPELFIRHLPPETLKLTVLVAFISGVITSIDRWLLDPSQVIEIVDAKTAVVAVIVAGTIIAISFAFMIISSIFFPLVLKEMKEAESVANAWTTIFCFIWFSSSFVCLIDMSVKVIQGSGNGPVFALLSLLGTHRSFFGMNAYYLLPCIGYTLIAYGVLWLRTYWTERSVLTRGGSILSFVFLVPFNALLMYVAIAARFDQSISSTLFPPH